MDDIVKELARLLATAYAYSGDETPRVYFFTREEVPTLGASEQIRITIRREHRAFEELPKIDFGYVETTTI